MGIAGECLSLPCFCRKIKSCATAANSDLGLHILLKSIQKPCNLLKYKGKTLGVDAYSWLHKGIISCVFDLALGKPTRKLVALHTSFLTYQRY